MEREITVKEVEATLEAEIIKHLKKAEEDIENGRTIPANRYFKKLRVQYGY